MDNNTGERQSWIPITEASHVRVRTFPAQLAASWLFLFVPAGACGAADQVGWISAKVEYLVYRRSSGRAIGLVNSKGVIKDRLTATKGDHSKDPTVTVRLKWGRAKSAHEWCTGKSLPVQDNAMSVVISAGEIRIVESLEK
jgi:hypothetical protein